MALPTPVQTATNTSLLANISATFGSNTTKGNLLIAIISGNGTTFPSSVTDNQSNSWTLINQLSQAGSVSGNNVGSACYLENNGGGVTTVTANGTSANAANAMVILEYPLTGTGNLDQKAIAGNNASSSASSGNTGTLAQANELIVGWVTQRGNAGLDIANPTSPSPPNDLTVASSTTGAALAASSDGLSLSTAAQSASYTVQLVFRDAWACGVVTFKIPLSKDDGGGYYYGGQWA